MKDSLQCPRVFHWVAISNFLLRSLGRDALATHNHSTVLHDGAVGADKPDSGNNQILG